MSKLIYLLLIPTLFSCSSSYQEKNSVAQNESFNFLIDTIYKYKIFKGVLNDEWLEEKEISKYFLLDSLTISFLLNHENSPIKAPYYGARCVAKQNKIENIQPIILYVQSDDYSSYLMVLLDEKNEPINYKEIAGGWFFFPNEKDTIMEFNEKRYCNIIDDSMMDYYITRDISLVDTTAGDAVFRDSISYKIKMERTGKFTTTLIDSLRIPIEKYGLKNDK